MTSPLPPKISQADEQLRYLLDAAGSVDDYLAQHPEDTELAAKAVHLAVCVFAVDYMIRHNGGLPAAWTPPPPNN